MNDAEKIAALRLALEFYADPSNYDEEGVLVYLSLSPPEGWCGEEYDAHLEPDEGSLARSVLADLDPQEPVVVDSSALPF